MEVMWAIVSCIAFAVTAVIMLGLCITIVQEVLADWKQLDKDLFEEQVLERQITKQMNDGRVIKATDSDVSRLLYLYHKRGGA
jgi:uncharacterized membrane protein (DUF106 family)